MNLVNPAETQLDLYRKRLLGNPTDPNDWAELLHISTDSNDLTLAKAISQCCSALCLETEWITLYKGYLSLREGNPAAALAVFQELALKTGSQDVIMWTKKWSVDALLDQGETEEAARLLLDSRDLPSSINKVELEDKINDYLDSKSDSNAVKTIRNFPVTLIAFYLPQFHPFPENDKWWGSGFSEWVNIADAEAHFPDHYQPRRPGALGFYDLRNSLTQRQQATLAKKYGISAFCYYLYWFSGKELMEEPINNMLKDKTIDIDFCLCWANETWSRRWDGSETDILIEQKYTEEDTENFPNFVSVFFRDPRYLRIDTKPLLLVYRPDQIPNTYETIARWRAVFKELGIGEVHLAACMTFGYTQERAINDGFDSANEFHPHNSVANELNKSSLRAKRFDGKIYDYREVVANSVKGLSIKSVSCRHPCVMLAWDNTPRRGSKGNVFTYFSFHYYGAWILVNRLKLQLSKKKTGLIFINAWNEWCEGTYLEPDRVNGFNALEATFQATKINDFLPVLLVALKLTAPYYENIRTYLLERLSTEAARYVDFVMYLSETRDGLKHSLFWFNQDSLATYYYEKEEVIVCAEVDTSSSQQPSRCIRGWISSEKLTLPTSVSLLIGTESEYCSREETLKLDIGSHRKDVANYHAASGRSFKLSNDWSVDISSVNISEQEIIQAIVFSQDDWLEAARINTSIVQNPEDSSKVCPNIMLLDRLNELSRLANFWQSCAKISWLDSSQELRASLLNSIDNAYITYNEISGTVE